ncbi:MAG: GntR family transcriptional regulator [Propionibacteriaceae bacterium]|nr:GntR family transcriptional regulator [Propionibacteriaceae bacterium]
MAAELAVNRKLLSDQVYDLILASILDGTRAPGSRVVESEIARTLGVSQAPVREAVKKLAHAGLLTSIARNGSYVTEISREEVTFSREIRAAIESAAARVVTERAAGRLGGSARPGRQHAAGDGGVKVIVAR